MTTTTAPIAIAQKFEVAAKLADAIESGEFEYGWVGMSTCIIGGMACIAMGMNSDDLWDVLDKENDEGRIDLGIWSTLEVYRCESTGLPLSEVSQALEKIGIDIEGGEIEQLEFTSNSIVRKELNSNDLEPDRHDANFVTAYLRAYAELGHEGKLV